MKQLKKSKKMLLLIATMMTGVIATSCSNMEESNLDATQDAPVTRAVGTKTPKLTVYVETNGVNPLNAGEYYFTNTSPREEVVDHVILFASNIRGTATTVQLYHNANQTFYLNNVSTRVVPLQQKGIKVLLGLLGDHTGVGFANLTPAMITDFAQQIATCVTTYGLDGVDFDDEYAKYGQIPGLPSPSSTIFGNLIKEVRRLLPNKLITVFNYGGYTYFDQTTMNAIDYMWNNFGNGNPPPGLPLSKYAKLAVNYQPLNPSLPALIQQYATNYNAGAIMTFNLRASDCSTTMNYFASRVWGGRTVSWTGTSHAWQ